MSAGATTRQASSWQRFSRAETLEERCQAWLDLQCSMLSDLTDGLLVLGTSVSAPAACWPEDRAPRPELLELAANTIQEGRDLAMRLGPPDDVENPAPWLVSHLLPGGETSGVVVVATAPCVEADLGVLLRSLQWGGHVLASQLGLQSTVGGSEGVDRDVLDLVAATLSEPSFDAASRAAVSELSRALECERASLGVVAGDQVRVAAISHSAHFGREMNLVRRIAEAMQEAIDQNEAIVYPPDADEPVQLVDAHRQLAEQEGSGVLLSFPFEDASGSTSCLLLERATERPFDEAERTFAATCVALVAPILEARRRGERSAHRVAVDGLRESWQRVTAAGRTARQLSLALGAAALLGLLFFPIQYRVSADAGLEGSIQRALVVPFAAYIVSAERRAGDTVKASEVLATLDDRDLRLERLQWESQRQQVQRQYDDALAQRARADVRILRAQVEQANAEIALLDQKLSRTEVRAPFDGLVVSGDLSQSLGSSVERGEVLFRVAPLDRYRVVLHVDETQIADVEQGARGTLVLSALPGERLPFQVELVTPVSTADEGANLFRVEASLEGSTERLRPGMEGVGKIEAGRRPFVWVVTREFVTWLRLQLWAWLP